MSLLQDNWGRLAAVADALGPLHERAVYVGGAVVGLYADRHPQEELRLTKDVDFFLEIVNRAALESLRLQLRQQGFQQSPEDKVMCRFRLKDIRIDVMSTREIDWAPANPWFEPGLQHLWRVSWEGIDFQLLSAPFFLATKLSAFYGRGGNDPRMSHDIEDMVYVLHHRLKIEEELSVSPASVRAFLRPFAARILSDVIWRESVLFNLPAGNHLQKPCGGLIFTRKATDPPLPPVFNGGIGSGAAKDQPGSRRRVCNAGGVRAVVGYYSGAVSV